MAKIKATITGAPFVLEEGTLVFDKAPPGAPISPSAVGTSVWTYDNVSSGKYVFVGDIRANSGASFTVEVFDVTNAPPGQPISLGKQAITIAGSPGQLSSGKQPVHFKVS